jgi:hypothetical protein
MQRFVSRPVDGGDFLAHSLDIFEKDIFEKDIFEKAEKLLFQKIGLGFLIHARSP